MANETIANLFGIKPPKAWTSSKSVPLPNPSPNLLMGVELEVENCAESWNTPGFKVVTDGSLRNNGLEFISQPMTYSNMVFALNQFYAKNTPVTIMSPFYEDEYDINSNYSDRTSIHVHTNVSDLTLKSLQTICLLYEVFEGLLFKFIGNDRDKNIFCVPWQETTLSYSVIPKLVSNPLSVKSWQKYTALNLLPILTQGSIEWRHMHGNSNMDFIATWLRIIGHIFAYSTNNEFEKVREVFTNLNTSSAYEQVMDNVFQADSDRLRSGDYRQVLEDGVLAMKFALMEENKPKVTSNTFGLAGAGPLGVRMWEEMRAVPTERLVQEFHAMAELNRVGGLRAPAVILDDIQEDNR